MITEENKLEKAISDTAEKCMIKREMYKGVKVKTLTDFLEYLEEIISIDEKTERDTVLKKLNNKNLSDKHVWVLFGKKCQEDGVCLQVAESIDIKSEIKTDIEFMFKKRYSELKEKISEKNIIILNFMKIHIVYNRGKLNANIHIVK